ncbi:GNAT family N-acetyltransferase [Aquimarina agarivorans]|uniref:GNAT family N-acetyltransferase n=1 Tax=Aquimarina agarivorans TaxID=980584 RepID=UPI000248E741|nr:GNAT family N-acetyltransferase [Aquimarina agarivorans]
MLDITIKSFETLTKAELYAILRIRSEVFVVEQLIAYQDLDQKDQKAMHIIGRIDSEIVAYTRIFKPNDYFKYASIGRVLVAKKYRRFNYGRDIVKASISAIEAQYGETTIKISAQLYLKRFYTELGFESYGDVYLEDEIPHTAMLKQN